MMPQPIRAGISGTKMFAIRRSISLTGRGVLRLPGRLDRGALGGQFVRRAAAVPGRCRCRGPAPRVRCLDERFELRGDPGDRARAEHDLVRVVLDHAHHLRAAP